jgi:hypothetical protein
VFDFDQLRVLLEMDAKLIEPRGGVGLLGACSTCVDDMHAAPGSVMELQYQYSRLRVVKYLVPYLS